MLQLLIHQRADAVVLVLFSVFAREFKAEATTAFLNHLRTNVRRHDHKRVLEVDGASFGIGQATIFQELKEQVEDIRVGLLDLIEQHHGVGPTTHGFGELPPSLKPT